MKIVLKCFLGIFNQNQRFYKSILLLELLVATLHLSDTT